MSEVSEDEKSRMAEMWNRGMSATQIAAKFRNRTRNSVIGVITRMRNAGDPRIVRDAHRQREWTDAESLKLLALHENDGKGFPRCGEILMRTGEVCKRHYEEIIADMKRAGMI